MADLSANAEVSSDLNRSCFCMTLDREVLCRTIQDLMGDPAFCREHVVTRPNLFSNVPVFLPKVALAAMQNVVAAIDEIGRLPAYQKQVLSWAPEIANTDHGPAGAFMGFDFHFDQSGPRLIEINTNAGGGILNALLGQAQRACCAEMIDGALLPAPHAFEEAMIEMFREEWRRQRGNIPLKRIAIVDERPEAQFLYPEFLIAQKIFRQAGIDAVIADPQELEVSDGIVMHGGNPVDLIYNRLVDFAFEQPANAALKHAYETGVVVTPNPHNHALYADKRNLIVLSDPRLLAEIGVAEQIRETLKAVPRTMLLTPDNAAGLWEKRKGLFFKPARGYGSKAVYRGDKITRSVWAQIVQADYIAQEFAPPSERAIRIDGTEEQRKMDVRLYTYGSRILMAAARLYQGQTTNFRTPGGGFAPVFAV